MSVGQHHEITVTDRIWTTDGIEAQFRHGKHGEVRPHVEFSDKVCWNYDRQRAEGRRMSVDRANNHYIQEWYVRDTGEVAWRKEGKLDDAGAHGRSARRKIDATTARSSRRS